MQLVLRSARYVLPVAFFGYAAVFNLEYARFPDPDEVPLDATALRGALTARMDEVYRRSLPHRDPAIGVMGALRYVTMGEGRKGVVTGSDGWLYTAEEVRPLTGALDGQLDRIAGVRDQLARAGAALVVVPVPGKLDVHVAHGDPEAAKGIASLYDDFLAGLRARDVPVLDARAALRAEARHDLAFFRTDTHWTPEGARAVAQALAGSGLVQVGDARFRVRSAGAEAFTGDLVSFVTTDDLAPMVGLAPEAAVPFTADPLADAETLDIFAGAQAGATLLIGTSYSANPTWSFAESLKLALGRDVLNLAAEGQGPARPMLDYLASADFRAAPPDVVIWEFPVRYLTDPGVWEAGDKEDHGA